MARRGQHPPGSDPSRRSYLKLRSALYDRVTGLPAFPLLIDDLRAMLDDRRFVGVLALETENLDLVESLYGWQVLDQVLGHLAASLKGAVGVELPARALVGVDGVAGDRMAAFVPHQDGGEEVTPNYLDHAARKLAARLQGALAHDEFAGLSPELRVRVGHALLSFDPFYRFERRVYAALDEARSLRRRRDLRRRRNVGEELKRIIHEPTLRVVFQPVIDLRSREVLGYEAFSRGPRDSPLEMPRALFALSDRYGMAADVDRACRDAALRACAGTDPGGKIFLNALAASFRDAPDRREGWPAALRPLAEDPHDLVLEFSIRSADADPAGFVATLERVKACGFAVALDDVGTGYASQAVLEKLRPDYLKLDVSLVRKIDQNLIKQEILLSLIRIAERMEASVIAEGVETQAEADALLRAGAQYGQGYLFAQPAPRFGELKPPPAGRR